MRAVFVDLHSVSDLKHVGIVPVTGTGIFAQRFVFIDYLHHAKWVPEAFAKRLVIVKHRADIAGCAPHMADFAGETRFAVVDLAVDDDAETDAPAEVEENQVVDLAAVAVDIFAVGHCAGVVFDAHAQSEFFGEDLAEGHFLEVIAAVAVAHHRVDAARDVDIDGEDRLAVDRAGVDEVVDDVTELREIVDRVARFEINVKLFLDHFSAEVHQAERKRAVFDVYAYEIAGFGIEAIGVGMTSALGLGFAALSD